MLHAKIFNWSGLQQQCKTWRQAGETIVLTNGCFDLLHAGHVTYLAQTKQCGDWLIVAVNSDASIQRLKGQHRPIQSEKERLTVLAGLASIDALIIFNTDTPLALIKKLQPDVLVKGADYSLDTMVGADVVKAYGGCVQIMPYLPGISTTNIIQRCQNIPV